jgi:hypothetical protein
VPQPDSRDFSTEGRTEFVPKRLDLCPAIPVAVASKSVPGHVLVEKVPGTEFSGALSDAECRIMAKAVDDISNWLESIAVGPIIHAKKDDLEKKGKGLELLFAGFNKKIEAAKSAPPAAAAAKPAAPVKAAPAPVVMMDTGDLD